MEGRPTLNVGATITWTGEPNKKDQRSWASAFVSVCLPTAFCSYLCAFLLCCTWESKTKQKNKKHLPSLSARYFIIETGNVANTEDRTGHGAAAVRNVTLCFLGLWILVVRRKWKNWALWVEKPWRAATRDSWAFLVGAQRTKLGREIRTVEHRKGSVDSEEDEESAGNWARSHSYFGKGSDVLCLGPEDVKRPSSNVMDLVV